MLFLLIFFFYPTLKLLTLSVETPDLQSFSLAAYRRAFGASVYLGVLRTTFAIALQTTLFCLVLGYPLAYWLAGLAPRRRNPCILLVMLPFWTSALVKSFAWLVLLARRGPLAKLLALLSPTGQAPELLHGRGAVLMGMVHTMLPLAVLTMLPVMLQINTSLGRAATSLGASPATRFWRIYFHLSMPGVTAAGLLVFIFSLGFFITPALLGGPHETMIGQVILEQIQSLLDWPFGGALAAMLVITAGLASLAYDRLFGLSAIADTRQNQNPPGPLRRGIRLVGAQLLGLVAQLSTRLGEGIHLLLGGGTFGWLLGAYAAALIGFLLIPTLLILPMAFTTAPFLEFPPPGFGLRWMKVYLYSPVWMAATFRSFGVATLACCLTTVIAGSAALGVVRSRMAWSRAVFMLFLAPMIVPAIVTAVGLFYLFAKLSLVTTDLGLVIGHTVLALPVAFVALAAVLRGHDWDLDRAAATLGANRLMVIRRITIPLIRGGVLAALLFAFIASFEELTVAIFISGGLKTTLPKQMWDDVVFAVNPSLAAASVIVLTVVTVLFLIAERLR